MLWGNYEGIPQGSARSTVLTAAVASVLPNTEIIAGNYFGSVTAGLTHWSNLIYR
ncbi:hypothetical protein RJD38_11530 [Vibrio scophthalmi]|uniref:hypothetical protein n=1 Tax=Vibrio scophthalmi TaxID=45658 RepID=UPI00349F517A